MSLVNDMQRDLENRKRVPPQAAPAASVSKAPRRRVSATTSWVAAAIAVSMVAGLAAGYLLFRDATPAPEAMTASPALKGPPEVADAVTEPPHATTVPVNMMDIVQEAADAQGFTLRVQAEQAVQYNIVSRDTYGLTLHLDGIDNYSKGATTFTGMSVLLESGGANIEFDLDTATDFMVFEDAATPGFDIMLQASYRPATTPDADVFAEAYTQPASLPSAAQMVAQAPWATDTAGEYDAAAPLLAAAESSTSVPGRVTRELTVDQLDVRASRDALALMQAGQLLEARRDLQGFIDANPAAQQSRATLATLLLLQQDFAQAEAVVDEGLTEAPNFAPYKKIKARILMQQGDNDAALALLREFSPTVAEDVEYHEILASLYQQNGLHPQAVATWQDLLRHDRQQGRWWAGMAVSLEAQGNTEDALHSFQAALQAGNLDESLQQYSQSRIQALGRARP